MLPVAKQQQKEDSNHGCFHILSYDCACKYTTVSWYLWLFITLPFTNNEKWISSREFPLTCFFTNQFFHHCFVFSCSTVFSIQRTCDVILCLPRDIHKIFLQTPQHIITPSGKFIACWNIIFSWVFFYIGLLEDYITDDILSYA